MDQQGAEAVIRYPFLHRLGVDLVLLHEAMMREVIEV